MANLLTLVSFNSTNGSSPYDAVLLDASGDLFGTTHNGGTSGSGTIFELARSGAGYASNTTVLASLNSGSGAYPFSNVIFDNAGDLLAATTSVGSTSSSSIIMLAKTSAGYASSTTVLANASAAQGNLTTTLTTDTAGDIFATGSSGGFSTAAGTVVELAHSGTGYGTSLATLASFTAAQGAYLGGGLVLDATGDLFGVTSGENSNVSTAFEIAKTATGYAAPVTLATLAGTLADAPLVIDAGGDLFGTTETGGTSGHGTVFEIAKTAGGYASTSTTLVNFNGTNGNDPLAPLLIDAAGNLFGTTNNTAFEVLKTATGYLGTPVTLASFTGSNGQNLNAGLSVDAAGDLFSTTTSGGSNNLGTVFELTNTGFVVGAPKITGTLANQSVNGQAPLTPFSGITLTDSTVTAQTLTLSFSAANGTLSGLGSGSYNAASGTYTDTGNAAAVTADLRGLVFTPAASSSGNVTTAFTLADNDGAGGVASDTTSSVISVNPVTIGAPVYRFYNPANEGHFFTSSQAEVASIQAGNSGLVLEGAAFNAVNPANDAAAATVYRFYQPANNSHFYTDNVQEVQQVQASRPDMQLEGPTFSVDTTMQAGDTAVYRYYETRSDTHLYTSSATEMSAIASTRPDLILEGPAFYVKA